MQREHRLEGQLAPCPSCDRQPRAVNTLGRDLWHLECAPCELRTTKRATLQEAVEAWESLPRAVAV
ncbi:hypothetical protein MBSD_n2679 [Mizugakiibacter sediminis]|uniref:Uncharacterized protein n=1 Tax=Mizugakiibacter sediminis TaxID=1475481 RepID=A0A0K8QR13_9GAMM|nr:hypothetical protein [Mizugakiibacter sediminis]GAP67358.1 hypothetical protein MBSD_n2679 [Mizugakiibacter sediminis]